MARCAAGGRTHAARLTALLLLARCRTSPGAEQAMPKGVFDFGSNWHDFVAQLTLSGDRSSEIYDAINAAMWQLARTISPIGFDIEEGIPDKTVFANSSFLDIGCGSGIHSASAAFLGSPHITSFDIQEGSVMATNVMKEVLQPLFKGSSWEVRQGSILQQESLEALSADVVYSWGVLHHTGQMWDAIRNACRAVPRPEDGGGVLFVALYALEVVRDVDYWIRVKTKYLAEPEEGKKQMEREYAWFVLKDAAINGNKNPFGMIYENPLQRGMDFWTDVKDWLGGLPIEFSEAHEVIRFVRQQCGLVPARVVPSTVTEFIFVTDPEDPRLVPTDERLVGRWHESMRSMTTIELRPPFTWLDLSAERRRVCFAVKLALPEHLNTSTVLFDLKEDGYDFGFGIELEEERRLEALDEMFESEEVQLQQKRREWVARFGPDGHTCERPGRYFRQLWSWSGEAVVVFSTSDGSDPNKNGRRYSVHIEPGTGEPPAPAASQREILYSSADLQWTRHG